MLFIWSDQRLLSFAEETRNEQVALSLLSIGQGAVADDSPTRRLSEKYWFISPERFGSHIEDVFRATSSDESVHKHHSYMLLAMHGHLLLTTNCVPKDIVFGRQRPCVPLQGLTRSLTPPQLEEICQAFVDHQPATAASDYAQQLGVVARQRSR